ncbi:Eco57I restriction-modification methylase domain-containing protein [Romboutsia lituseburensis]|uniref:Eco57I restriction-modification methylase domain-containing protein n=1 Tax=Romboutsia lituseburensis TaxID=1537 RepID=UPI0022EA5081|nr:hypothetical protein [Romboutsia lituseburensis]
MYNQMDILKRKQIEFILKSSEYNLMLEEIKNNIITGCKKSTNEATTATVFELELYSFLKNILNLNFHPEKEVPVGTVRHVSKGRIDSKIGVLLIEYKYNSKLKTNEDVLSATNQLKDYMNGLYVKNQSNDYLGIITDGIQIKFIRLEKGIFFEESIKDIECQDIDRLIKSILLLQRVSLNSKNLVEDFKLEDGKISKNLSVELYDALISNSCDRTNMLFNEWKVLFNLSHNDKSKQKAIEERRIALEKALGTRFTDNKDEEYKAMFAIQTTYAIIVKIIAFKVISNIYFNKSKYASFYDIATSNIDTLKGRMQLLEEGEIFRDLGFSNLLEGDFFSWYSSNEQWNENIANYIKSIFITLSKYEDKSIFTEFDDIHDLFNDLYTNIMPDKVRHCLGEFYTQPWLADNVIDSALKYINNSEWKGIDPCGGSGTFITRMIAKVIKEIKSKDSNVSNRHILNQVLSRIKAVDLNPLAVLTLRVNYFINVSQLIDDGIGFEIPVYLGDSANVPEIVNINEVKCIKYVIKTLKKDINIELPISMLRNTSEFTDVMYKLELDIKSSNIEAINSKLISLVPESEMNDVIKSNINELAETLVYLEENNWNGIWVRIIKNYLITATLSEFDIIVGNPPWVDWKNLPSEYRDKIKNTVCIDNSLFSGANRTGGINLNICALISNVVSNRFLKENGTLAVLMPKSLIHQASYEGFRKFTLKDKGRLYLQEIHDWTESGHPFNPVKEKFLTYVYNNKVIDYSLGTNVIKYKIKKGYKLSDANLIQEMQQIDDWFNKEYIYAGETSKNSTCLSYVADKSDLKKFQSIAGKCEYKGREGIEFYPQEVFLLELEKNIQEVNNCIFLKNYQNNSSKHKSAARIIGIEKEFLHPLVRGREIGKYNWSGSEYIVPFPYEEGKKIPIPIKELTSKAPKLARYFMSTKEILANQSDYNDKIINNEDAAFYALARVGEYTYSDYSVAYRDNTKWQATVIERIDTEWGKNIRPLFQNHAVSMTQDREGNFITREEAHYICAILNAPIVSKYVTSSSDSRSFKIDPPIYVPKFDANNENHKMLSELSIKAHDNYEDIETINKIDKQIDEIYLKMCGYETR